MALQPLSKTPINLIDSMYRGQAKEQVQGVLPSFYTSRTWGCHNPHTATCQAGPLSWDRAQLVPI